MSDDGFPIPAAPDDETGVVRACRALHAAIDRLDSAAADSIAVSRNDLRCINLLETGPMSPKRIAAQLALRSGSVTALIDRLENKGLVRRRPDPRDRRALVVEATPAVYERLGPVYRRFAEALIAMTMERPEAERVQMAQNLSDVAAACERALPKAKG